MNTTTNYGLYAYEGSDEFNPLAVDVPNINSIDSIMKANSDKAIPTATHVLSGTVHAIVRADSDAPMFRFVATADFTFGDSFTIDGIAYTAKLSSGEQLNTNAFVTGANVLCCVTGTEFTLFVASTGTAPDSAMLGGELPSYYAKQSDMGQAQLDIADNADDISDINGELHNVISGSLGVGATTVTLIDARIKITSIIEPWQYIPADGNDYELIYPTRIAVSSGQCTLTYDAQSIAYTVGVRVFG